MHHPFENLYVETQVNLLLDNGLVMLEDPQGSPFGAVLEADSGESANALVDLHGEPSFALVNASESRFLLVYLLEPTPADAKGLSDLSAHIERLTGYGLADQQFPTPGFGGWDWQSPEDAELVSDGAAPKFSLADMLDRFGSDDVHEERLESFVQDLPTNDAVVHGRLPDVSVLDRPMKLGFSARGSEDKVWKNFEFSLGDWLHLLTQHTEGKKDGPSMLTGSTIDNTRRKTTMSTMYVAGIDLDNGVPIPELLATLTKLGKLAVVYTTHSHNKTQSDIAQHSYLQFCKKEKLPMGMNPPDPQALQRYLLEKRFYTPEIVATCQFDRMEQTARGMLLFVKHDPMPKARVLFPLDKPFVFAERPVPHKEAMEDWGQALVGLSRELAIPIDQSCLDPSRLFYNPRHPKGGTFETHVVCGPLLDIDSIPRAKSGLDTSNAFLQFASEKQVEDYGFDDDRTTPKGLDLVHFVRENSHGFDIAQLFRENCPDKIRLEDGDKVTVECPFDGEHSNPGDEEDMGCFVADGAVDLFGAGFVFRCSHNGCANRPRRVFLAEAIRQEWFDEELLTDERYVAEQVEEGAEEAQDGQEKPEGAEEPVKAQEAYRVARKRAEALDPNTPQERIAEKVLRVMIEGGVTYEQRDAVLKIVGEQTKQTPAKLTKTYKDLEKRVRKELQEEERKAQSVTDLKRKPVFNVDDEGFEECIGPIKERFMAVNAAEPHLFHVGDQKVQLNHSPAMDSMSTSPLQVQNLRTELVQTCTFVKSRGEAGDVTIHTPLDVAQYLLTDRSLKLPVLAGIVGTPFFTSDANGDNWRLVSQEGYDMQSRYYLHYANGLTLSTSFNKAPTKAEAFAARDFVLDNVFIDFPFAEESSKTHALAMLLLFFMRGAIKGPTPIHYITKPQPGTGAGLLCEAILQIATGQPAKAQTEKRDTDEVRKSLTSTLMSGAVYYWLDNINNPIMNHNGSGEYSSAVTTPVWEDRILGSSTNVQIPMSLIFIFCGNHVQVSDEVRRRCLPMKLDAKMDPTERTGFKHDPLSPWVRANRQALVEACLTMIMYWVAQGKPRYKGKKLASFEVYCSIMGGLLDSLEMPGFLQNLDVLKEAGGNSEDALLAFLEVWWQKHKSEQRMVGNPDSDQDGEFDGRESLVSLITENGIEMDIKGHDGAAKRMSLGRQLGFKVDNVFTFSDGSKKILRRRTLKGQKFYWIEPAPTAETENAPA